MELRRYLETTIQCVFSNVFLDEQDYDINDQQYELFSATFYYILTKKNAHQKYDDGHAHSGQICRAR